GLSTGQHTVTATYSGSANFNVGSSTPITQTVNQDASTTTLTSSLNPALVGQTVTFTAIVANASGTAVVPTGTVTFLDAGASIGSGTLTGGSGTFSTSTFTQAPHTITASYSGDNNFSSSDSTAITQSVLLASATTVSSSLNPTLFGRSVTFTATVTGTGGTPTGTVQFIIDGSAFGAPVTLSSGKG